MGRPKKPITLETMRKLLKILTPTEQEKRVFERLNKRAWKRRPLCGARTRQGTPCQRHAVCDQFGNPRNGRCPNHGGLSTGPRKKGSD